MRCSVMMLGGIVVLAAVLGGCKSSSSPIFFTSPESPYPDIPIPASFSLVSQSPVGALGAVSGRAMEYGYEGKDGLQPVIQFFSEHLPKKGWVLQSQSPGTGRMQQNYAKGGELLQVDLSSVSAIRTSARIRIMPAGG